MPKHRKVCPHCGAPRFYKREVVEIVSGREKVVDTEYTCRNQFCQRVTQLDDMREQVMVEIVPVEDDAELVE